MNRSRHLVLALSLALVPCAALLAGCPEETKAVTADSSLPVTTTPPSASTALTVAAPTGTPAPIPAAADAGPPADAAKDAAKPASKK